MVEQTVVVETDVVETDVAKTDAVETVVVETDVVVHTDLVEQAVVEQTDFLETGPDVLVNQVEEVDMEEDSQVEKELLVDGGGVRGQLEPRAEDLGCGTPTPGEGAAGEGGEYVTALSEVEVGHGPVPLAQQNIQLFNTLREQGPR